MPDTTKKSFTTDDIQQIENRGSDLTTVEEQIHNFIKGFPYLQITEPATIGKGIIKISGSQIDHYVQHYENKSVDLDITKFVPASGAASRMFKSLFSYLEKTPKIPADHQPLTQDNNFHSVYHFFQNLDKFAFYDSLKDIFKKKGLQIEELQKNQHYTSILETLLTEEGLGYGELPKGLLDFHHYENFVRTPVEEHLVEGASYARGADDLVKIHFTVSPEHREKFLEHVEDIRDRYESLYDVTFDIAFSEQKSYTDTIAVTLDNDPFREVDGRLLFRPAGHGALIANLNEIDSDIIFIKNIDNVVPDKLKETTIKYKKALAGLLLQYQEKLFGYQQLLDSDHELSWQQLQEIAQFLEKELFIQNIPKDDTKSSLTWFLRKKVFRPVRVCGMVKNEGEPGGGPFFARNHDDTISLQIAESSQINLNDPMQKQIADSATHFNPVDLVCGAKDYKGEKYDLTKFVDHQTGFISQKSKNGQELKAQELPGLWNGSMSDWNTLFVEVPVITFNPVKAVNDLLRDQHQ